MSNTTSPAVTSLTAEESKENSRLKVRRIVAYAVLIIMVIISLLPFYLLLMNATRPKVQSGIRWVPDKYLMDNFRKLFSGTTATAYGNIFRSLLNSLFISATTSLLSVYFSALTAYAIHVYNFKLKKIAHTFILIIMMVPTQASAIGFYRLMKDWGLTDSYIPLIIPAIAAPSIYYFMISYMSSSLPLEIVEASRIDGCGEFRTFNQIVCPILKPAFAVQIIFTFVSNWNNFFMPRLILNEKSRYTIPLVLSAMRHAGPKEMDTGMFNLYIVIAILPVVIVYLCLSKFIIRGVALGSVKG
ncbi:MAG: carbohydrate ABC transporter permease [Hominimerdicola sp.]